MDDQLQMFAPTMCGDSPNATGSLDKLAGPEPSNSPASRPTNKSGRRRSPASHGAAPDSASEKTTSAISGPISSSSSKRANRHGSSENKSALPLLWEVQMKRCSVCGVLQPSTQFRTCYYRNADGRRSLCSFCQRKYETEWRKKAREQAFVPIAEAWIRKQKERN